MNDITALMQSLKSALENVTPGPWITVDFFWIAQREVGLGGEFIACNNGPDADYLKLLSPDNVLALVEALEKAQRELAKSNSVLEKIKSTSCHVDTSEGSFIPNSLDAWGRPVPQHLPYDFSGNPGASATQYCNGWNDSGGYWLNYVRELESRTVTVKLPAEYLNADGSVNADMANTCPVVSAYREAHRAAGIQVIEGEGK